MDGLQFLANAEYPGRFIAAGLAPDRTFMFLYGLTGRSSPSRARLINQVSPDVIKIDPLDPNAELPPDAPLIYYDAIHFPKVGVTLGVITNGAQTNLVSELATKQKDTMYSPVAMLAQALAGSEYRPGKKSGEFIDIASFEPDSPNYTSRISMLATYDRVGFAFLERSKRGTLQRRFYEEAFQPGLGWLIATYEGKNVPSGTPIPQFTNEPLRFTLEHSDPSRLAADAFNRLDPKIKKDTLSSDDFRVGVVAIAFNPDRSYEGTIINHGPEQTHSSRIVGSVK